MIVQAEDIPSSVPRRYLHQKDMLLPVYYQSILALEGQFLLTLLHSPQSTKKNKLPHQYKTHKFLAKNKIEV